jgi:hypothetical protein
MKFRHDLHAGRAEVQKICETRLGLVQGEGPLVPQAHWR